MIPSKRKVGSLEVRDWFAWDLWIFLIISDGRKPDTKMFNVLKYCKDGEFCSESCFGINVEVLYLGNSIPEVLNNARGVGEKRHGPGPKSSSGISFSPTAGGS